MQLFCDWCQPGARLGAGCDEDLVELAVGIGQFRGRAAQVFRLKRGIATLSRVMLASGAREVRTPLPHAKVVRSLADVEALERSPARARHFDLSAYHPLGTCRMGHDPLRSVVGPTHETHDVHNLYICDGSAVPGPIGANPQLTIMALSLRAAEAIDRRLVTLASAEARRATG